MTATTFENSDAVRSARPLKHAKTMRLEGPVPLEKGASLPGVVVAYETYGTLSAARDNAILICHAISGDSHVAMHDAQDDQAGGSLIVGPGKPTRHQPLLRDLPQCAGRCRGTSGPSDPNPLTGKPYGSDFPLITVNDMVGHPAPPRGSPGCRQTIGGHRRFPWAVTRALAWGIRHPARVAGVVTLATSPRLTTQALAFDVVGRNAISRDPTPRRPILWQIQRPGCSAWPLPACSLTLPIFPPNPWTKSSRPTASSRATSRRIREQVQRRSYLAYQGTVRRTFRRQQLHHPHHGHGPL